MRTGKWRGSYRLTLGDRGAAGVAEVFRDVLRSQRCGVPATRAPAWGSRS
ncbi:hypothetical protein [Lentzea sp. CC55]|nr:hypothetical protein [Lentzea sp. CC55]MCG8925952.1 hypothetical protein [Lentzea sp. CC55]